MENDGGRSRTAYGVDAGTECADTVRETSPLPGVDENRKISSNQDYCVLWISVALLLYHAPGSRKPTLQ